MSVVPADLRLSAQCALLGAIYPEMRLVKVKLEGSRIVITTIFDTKPSDACLDALSTAATEIIADFPDYDLEERISVTDEDLPREHILAEGWVYQRAER